MVGQARQRVGCRQRFQPGIGGLKRRVDLSQCFRLVPVMRHFHLYHKRFRAVVGFLGKNFFFQSAERLIMSQRSGIVALPLADLRQALRRLKCRSPCADVLSQTKGLDQMHPRLIQPPVTQQKFTDGEQRVGHNFLVLNGAGDFDGAGVAVNRFFLPPGLPECVCVFFFREADSVLLFLSRRQR